MKCFYRIVYRISETNVVKSPNCYDERMAHRIARDLNQQFRHERLGVYSVESIGISELDAAQLIRLFEFKLISYEELKAYGGSQVAKQALEQKYKMSSSV